MKRDLRLSYNRMDVSRLNYMEEIDQSDTSDDFQTEGMIFKNCLDHVEGGLFWINSKAERYEAYLSEKKKESRGNLWKYLRDVQYLYDGSHLSKEALGWNKKLLEKSQRRWFQWVEGISYPGIQEHCLFYAPSLDSLIDFMEYLKSETEESGETDNMERRIMLVMLLFQTFIQHMITIDGNMESDNLRGRSYEKWDVDKWRNEDAENYIRSFLTNFLTLLSEIVDSVLYAFLSVEWIHEKKILRDKYRRKFRDIFLEMLSEHCKERLPDIILSEKWELSKASLYSRLKLYCYLSQSSDGVSLNRRKDIQENLWKTWKELLWSDVHIISMIYNSEDGFLTLWSSGKLMSDETDMRSRYDEMLSEVNMRLDGWNYKYEKSRHKSDFVCCVHTVAAMAAEWKSREEGEEEKAEEFYWIVFGKLNKFVRGNRYVEEVTKKSLLQVWSRMVLLSKVNSFESKAEFFWKNLQYIDRYEYRIHVLDVLLKKKKKKGLEWDFDRELRKKILSFLMEEKYILEKEEVANPDYYQRYYIAESNALDRCINFFKE